MRMTNSLRIGDAERDAAISLLARHFADGRLTQTEHEERMALALKARYGSELDALFADLPRLDDAAVVPQQPRGAGVANALQVMVSAAMVFVGIFLLLHAVPLGLFVLIVLFTTRLSFGSRRSRGRVVRAGWTPNQGGWPHGRGGWPPGPGSYGRRW